MMHHYVWEKHHGPIPPKHVVRIVNGDRRDARIGNLELMSLSEWNKRFCPHLNQFTSPTGSRKHAPKLIDRVKAEREERWKRAMGI
jgi:HNH endonuclease